MKNVTGRIVFSVLAVFLFAIALIACDPSGGGGSTDTPPSGGGGTSGGGWPPSGGGGGTGGAPTPPTPPAFIAVTSITGVPTAATVSAPLNLTSTVAPSNATNQTISWGVHDAGTTGATISGNTLNTTAPGTVTVRATITNGAAVGTPFIQDFPIIVNVPTPISWIGSTANGTSETTTTTEITLTFDADPTALAVTDITVTGATRGTLSATGATRTLTISNIKVGDGGSLIVSISNPAGYAISPTAQNVLVFLSAADILAREVTRLINNGDPHLVTQPGAGVTDIPIEQLPAGITLAFPYNFVSTSSPGNIPAALQDASIGALALHVVTGGIDPIPPGEYVFDVILYHTSPPGTSSLPFTIVIQVIP